MKKYIVKLTKEERDALIAITRTGKHAATKIIHAKILLEADKSEFNLQDKTNIEIADSLKISTKTIQRVLKKFVEEGFEASLCRKLYPKRLLKISGDEEASLIALCCSNPPEGRTGWTLKLLANRLVEMNIFETISASTVRRTLKKTS